MKKKMLSILASIMIILVSITKYSFADNSGKVIFIDINRTNLDNMLKISSIENELKNRGYIGLMNIRGDRGTDDRRSFASMGAGGRANVSTEMNINFEELNDDTSKIYKSVTGKSPKKINDLTINKSLNENEEKGQYGSVLGSLGQILSENKLKVALLGNSDIIENGNLIKNRNLGLVAMDNFGRIDSGNIDNINIENPSMPFGIQTDYQKLTSDTKKYYESSNALFIELGDTYRLDLYKSYLNQDTYNKMQLDIYKNIDKYLNEIFKMVGENDTVYIVSGFPSNLDYKNKKRLSPIIKFKGDKKGILASATTRRDGIVANLDVGVDILNEFGLDYKNMVGKSYNLVDKNDNIEYLSGEYEKIVSISDIRSSIISGFVGVVSASWIIAMVLLVFLKDKIPYKYKIFNFLKEFIKLGFILPISFLIAPAFNFKSEFGISMGIILTTLVLYLIGKTAFKDDIKHMLFFSLLTIAVISIDSVIGTPLMKNSIMSYDAIIGARYYGMGNEYQGIAIGSAIFGLAVLLDYKKISKWIVAILCLIILITTASPTMGANVGAAISESIAYLVLVLLIFDVKFDYKKVILLGVFAVGVVLTFAAIDIISGSESHLSGFIKQIISNGPSEIIQTFSRKIQMNLKLAKTSVWVNILLAGVAIVGVLIFKPSRHFKKVAKKYPFVFKGFIATFVGCGVTLLVNDSGIVAAATASIYILIPLIIISINMILFNKE